MKPRVLILIVLTFGACLDAGSVSTNNGYSTIDDKSETSGNTSGGGVTDPPVERERFLVREVAASDTYVFVPNTAANAASVARIDARDLSIQSLTVGLNPTDVIATDNDELGAVAYVLCEGNSTVAVVRADQPSRDGAGLGYVGLMDVPREVNRLTMVPDGRSAVAWIDPERAIDSTAVASLQVLALVKLSEVSPADDEVFELSVTRLIRDIEFTDDGEMYLLGREGINRIVIDEISEDTFVPKLDLGLDQELFPADSLEMEVSPKGDFLVLRNSTEPAIALYNLTGEFLPKIVSLPGPATDIDLVETANGYVVIATSATADTVTVIDPALALVDPLTGVTTVPFDTDIGISQITDDLNTLITYSTIGNSPTLIALDLETFEQRAWPIRNQIASVAISSDSKTAVLVHVPQATKGDANGPDALFRTSEGLTLVDLSTGFRRPITLPGTPKDLALVETDTASILYAMLAATAGEPGVMRIDLRTFRSDFVKLPKEPSRLGRVTDQIFVSQTSTEGRITFFDINTNEQRTVSGYELNATID